MTAPAPENVVAQVFLDRLPRTGMRGEICRLRRYMQVLFVASAVSVAQAQTTKQLWVLQEPDEIVKYDVATFGARDALKVPRRLLEHPEYLSINAKGQMLFLPARGVQWGGGEMALAGDRVWFWDGNRSREWSLTPPQKRRGSAGKPSATETALQWFLSAGGESLVWFENRFEKIMDKSGLERSVRSSARVWRTDLTGGRTEPIARLSSRGWCRCATGTCSETCPEWQFWAPDSVVGDFFLATRFTPGQLGETYHESVLYRRSGRAWRVKKLPQPLLRPLTASEKAETLVAALPDEGCCGNQNEGNDQMLLLRSGEVSVLYDEFDRYDNRNYDVSFYVADARLGADNAMLAYTIVSSAETGTELRLSSDGKENTEELARLRNTIAELPAVEVVKLGTQPHPPTVIRHATLVGWLNEREILVAQGGRLAVYDIRGTKLRDTTIRARSAADAFLR